jgi:hypothetical protein
VRCISDADPSYAEQVRANIDERLKSVFRVIDFETVKRARARNAPRGALSS